MAGGMVIASHDAIQPWVGNIAIFDDLSGVATIANQYNPTKELFSMVIPYTYKRGRNLDHRRQILSR